MSSAPARGNAVRFAFARELDFGIPGEPLLDFRPTLPVDHHLVPGEEPGTAVNPSGFAEAGVPGELAGPWSFGHRLTAGHLLELWENLLGGVEKTQPEADVFRYAFAGDPLAPQTSLWSYLSTPPVERTRSYGVKIAKLEIPWGGNTEIVARATGQTTHGSSLGEAVAEGALAGAYPHRPILRGPLADPAAGDVWVTVEEVAPLSFRVEQAPAAPTFPGPAVAAAVDPATGRAVYQNLQGADGRDLGIWGENKDPLEIVWPGTAAEHALAAPGDTWRFPRAPAEPPLAYLPGAHQRFTSAHVETAVRELGGGAWIPVRNLQGTLAVEWALNPERGDGSRYLTELDRDGELFATLQLTQVYRNTRFVEWARRHRRFEFRLAFLGRQLGAGALRESVTLTLPATSVQSAQRPASGPNRIQQTLELRAETDALASFSPVEVVCVTPRDWEPWSPPA